MAADLFVLILKWPFYHQEIEQCQFIAFWSSSRISHFYRIRTGMTRREIQLSYYPNSTSPPQRDDFINRFSCFQGPEDVCCQFNIWLCPKTADNGLRMCLGTPSGLQLFSVQDSTCPTDWSFLFDLIALWTFYNLPALRRSFPVYFYTFCVALRNTGRGVHLSLKCTGTFFPCSDQ